VMSACLCATARPIEGLCSSSLFPGGVAEHPGGQTLINFVTEHRGDVSFNLARVSAVAKVLISGEDLCLNLASHILISAGNVAFRKT
jgi:hypothetical protein